LEPQNSEIIHGIIPTAQERVQTDESLIEQEPETLSHYWHLGLAYLWQGQEDAAQEVWLAGLTQGLLNPEQDNLTELIELLAGEAQQQEKQGATQWSWQIRQQIQALAPEEINNILNILSENNKRLIKLLTHLLNSANSARGQIIYNFTDGNIIDTCMACIKEFSCLANISFNLGEVKNVKLAYDEVKIGQTIRNILDNAIKYGESNIIKINLEESKEPKAIVIKIENTGN
jgi:signal transduction histidine kinase